jgi:hypothetical protein
MEFALAAAVLAGYGLAGLQALDPRTRQRCALQGLLVLASTMAIALLFLTAASATAHYRSTLYPDLPVNRSTLPWRNAAIALPLAALCLGGASLYLWCRRSHGWGQAVLLAGFLFDVGSGGWWRDWRVDTARPADLALPAGLAPLRSELVRTGQRVAPLHPYGEPCFAMLNRARLWGLPCALGYAPLTLRRHSDVTGAGYHGFTSFHAFAANDRTFDFLGLRYVLAPAHRFSGTSDPLLRGAMADLNNTERWREVGSVGEAILFENRRALPRAWLVGEVVVLEREQQVQAIRSGYLPDGRPFDPARTALLETPIAAIEPDPRASVQVVGQEDCQLDLIVHSEKPTLLVLADSDYPGWRATVNGRATPILRTNSLLRGVALPGGKNEVRFEYRPATRAWGGALSGISLLGTAALLVLSLRSASRRPSVLIKPVPRRSDVDLAA